MATLPRDGGAPRAPPPDAAQEYAPFAGVYGDMVTKELAQRLSGGDEILLVWHPESGRIELSVRDLETGEGFEIEVAAGAAIDAFRHPYAYANRRE